MNAIDARAPDWLNPIWQKSWRSRLRLKHLASWGIVTLTITAFVFLIIYTNMTERQMVSTAEAAKATLPGTIVIQAILLMMFGTGAVAAGVAQERDEGLLDYQRMTPMSPASKIFGYLFGLPVREYVLFALTLPFVLIAAVVSGFSLLTLAHFYLVFFTSVWVYHFTGLVAGMIAPKARLASMLSIGLVFALYFALPNLSRLGITYFEFLTIRPTFFGLLQQEMPEHMRARAEASGIDSFRDVPVFSGMMHPTAYTMLVQGTLLAVMFNVVHRKWRDPDNHLFSKSGALVVYAGVLFFLMASMWAIVSRDDVYFQVFNMLSSADSPEMLEVLLSVGLGIAGGAFVLLVAAVTPSRHTALRGRRRARKLARRGVGANSDAASSLPCAIAMLAVTIAAGAALVLLAGRSGLFFLDGPRPAPAALLGLAVAAAALFVQGLRELCGMRVFAVSIFLLWMVPFFAMMILISAFEAFIPAAYVGLPCPPVLFVFSIGRMLETTTPIGPTSPQFVPEPLSEEIVPITLVGTAGYALAAIVLQVLRARRWRNLASEAHRTPTDA